MNAPRRPMPARPAIAASRKYSPPPNWAVVLASRTEKDYYVSRFFDGELEAIAFIRESKAPDHGFALNLYRRVELAA